MRYFLLLTAFLLTSALYAQTGSVQGKLVDTATKQSMKDASVSVLTAADSTVEAFVLAKADGSFEIKNLPTGKFIVQIGFQGYTPVYKKIELTKANPQVTLGTIYMQLLMDDLGNVTVKQSPVVIKGDTVEFNAGSFKTKPNAVAEDLIKKLPGMEVSKDGTVKAQGEQVQRVLVDGKRFFGDDPKMATKNLPTDVIDKIQVFDAQSDQSDFTGFDDGTRTKTINIITKKDKRKGYFGKASVAAGNDGRYENSLNMNRFNGDQQITLIGQGNNVNRQGFSTQDMLGAMGNNGGGRGFRGGSGTSSGSGGITTTWAGGLNYRDNWGTKTQFSGSYFYNNQRINRDQRSYTENFIQNDSSIFSNQTKNTVTRNQNHRINLNIEHKFDSLNSLIVRPNISYQDNESNTESYTGTTKGKLINQNNSSQLVGNNRNGYNASIDATFRHRFKTRGRTLSFNVTTSNSTNDGNGTNYAVNTIWSPNVTVDTIDQINSTATHGFSMSNNISYTEPIAKNQMLELSYNYSYNRNTSDRQAYTFNDFTGKYDIVNTTLTNKFENTNQSNRVVASYRIKGEKFTAGAGLGVQFTELESINETRKTTLGQKFTNLYPTANMNYKFSRSQSLRFNYNGRTNQPSVTQLQDVLDNSDQLNLTIGNPALKQEFTHSIRMLYSSFDMITFKNFFASLNMSTTANKIVNANYLNASRDTVYVDNIAVGPGAQLTRPTNLNGTFSVSGFFNYGFPLTSPKSNLNFSTNVAFNQGVSMINRAKNYNRNTTLGETITWTMNLKEQFDMNFSSTSTYNIARYSIQPQQNANYFSQTFSVEPTYVFKSGWILASDFDYTFYKGYSAGYNTNIPLWNASLAKQIFKDKSGEIKFTMYDLLKQNVSIVRTVSDNYVSDVQTNVLQRYFMVSFTWNLRKFGAKGQQQQNVPPAMRGMFRRDGTPRVNPGGGPPM